MGTDIINYESEWEKLARTQQMAEGSRSVPFISTKGGVFTVGNDEIGDQMAVIILDSVLENTYYAERFQEGIQQSPKCYAFGRSLEEMGPHPAMEPDVLQQDGTGWFEPQNDTCKGCPMNEFGSGDTGRGKACQNRRRLAILPAGQYVPRPKSRDMDLELFGADDMLQVDPAYLKLPVTSVKNYGEYVNAVSAKIRRPTFGVITRVFLVPDKTSQYKIDFEMIEPLPADMLQTILDLREAVGPHLVQTYAPPREDDQPRGRGIQGLRGAGKTFR